MAKRFQSHIPSEFACKVNMLTLMSLNNNEMSLDDIVAKIMAYDIIRSNDFMSQLNLDIITGSHINVTMP